MKKIESKKEVSEDLGLSKIHAIGKVLLTGIGIGNQSATGKVCVANNQAELLAKFNDGDILVSLSTDKDMINFMRRASAIVTEHSGLTSHGAIVGLNLNKPTIIGAKDATKILKDGDIVTIDSEKGQVFQGNNSV